MHLLCAFIIVLRSFVTLTTSVPLFSGLTAKGWPKFVFIFSTNSDRFWCFWSISFLAETFAYSFSLFTKSLFVFAECKELWSVQMLCCKLQWLVDIGTCTWKKEAGTINQRHISTCYTLSWIFSSLSADKLKIWLKIPASHVFWLDFGCHICDWFCDSRILKQSQWSFYAWLCVVIYTGLKVGFKNLGFRI